MDNTKENKETEIKEKNLTDVVGGGFKPEIITPTHENYYISDKEIEEILKNGGKLPDIKP